MLNRTIMALWKARSLTPEQKVQIVEEESEAKSLQPEENGSFLGLEDVSMSEVYSAALPVPVSSLFLCLGECCLYGRMDICAFCLLVSILSSILLLPYVACKGACSSIYTFSFSCFKMYIL